MPIAIDRKSLSAFRSSPLSLTRSVPSCLDIHDNVDIDAANADLDALQLSKLAVLVRR